MKSHIRIYSPNRRIQTVEHDQIKGFKKGHQDLFFYLCYFPQYWFLLSQQFFRLLLPQLQFLRKTDMLAQPQKASFFVQCQTCPMHGSVPRKQGDGGWAGERYLLFNEHVRQAHASLVSELGAPTSCDTDSKVELHHVPCTTTDLLTSGLFIEAF